MSLTSFLTQDPMQYTQSSSQTSTTLPSWYNDYSQGILQNAAQFANQGYQAYGGPRVAGTTPDQQASYNTVAGQQGVGSGIAQQGVGTLNSTLQQPNASQAASPYLANASSGVSSALAQPNASQAANPWLAQAGAGVSSALSMPNATQAANPYLQSASTPLSQQMQQFMNPYTNSVVNNSNMLAARNFNENVLPGLQDQFTQAGQVYGGSRQGEYAERMGRDLNLNTQMADQSSLAQGFNTALGGAAQQAGINAGLGATAGSLANSAQNTGLSGAGINAGLGSTAGSLANASQNTGLSGAGINANLGATAGGLQNAAQNTGIAGAYGYGNLGTTAQNNALNQALMQNQMGQQQQGQTQANYNTAYQDFQNQTNFPLTAASAMQGALSGIQVPTGTTNYQYQPYGYGMSPLAQAGSLYGGFNSLLGQGGSLTGHARGGPIRFSKGGRVTRPTLKLPRTLERFPRASFA